MARGEGAGSDVRGTVAGAWQFTSSYLGRVLGEARHRREIGWVIGRTLVEFFLQFLTLKLFTRWLGQEGYGVFNLSLTALMLLTNAALMPVNQTYQRYFYTAIEKGVARAAGMTLFRWYAVVTIAVAVAGTVLSPVGFTWFGVGRWTIAAAALVFLANSWRQLVTAVLDIRRQRAAMAVHNLGFQALQIVAAGVVLSLIDTSATAALLSYAATAAVFAAVGLVLLLRWLRSYPPTGASDLTRMVVTYGLPYGALLVAQWAQSFSDRFIVGGQLGKDAVGVYAAAFQVCGLPFMMLLGFWNILISVAYQHARDVTDPRQLWSVDRRLLVGIALYLTIGAATLSFYVFFGESFLVLLTTEEFRLPTSILVCLAASRYLGNLIMALQLFFFVHQRMGTLLAIRALGGGGLTVGLSWFGVRHYGIAGAAAGTLIAAFLTTLLCVLGPGGVLSMVREARNRSRDAPAAP